MTQLTATLSPTDRAIYDAIQASLARVTALREVHAPIQIEVADGVVTVRGTTHTEILRRQVLFSVATVPGVQRVIDELWDDRDIEIAFGRALATDAELRGSQVICASNQGVVTLTGHSGSEGLRERLLKLAEGIPGVRMVSGTALKS